MNTESINRRDPKRRRFNPNKFRLEYHTQATQDILENGYGTHSSGADSYCPFTLPGVNDNLDAPLLSLDRRFIIRIPC
jgi:hypothetical protein